MKLDGSNSGLRSRIPVEPLDDERLTNIERRIVAGAADAAARGATSRATNARFGFALAVAVTVVVAIGAGFAGWQLRGDGSTTTKNVTVVAAEPVKVNTTAEHSTIDIGDARITSDPATNFVITRPDGGVLVTMKRGKVELDVDKRAGRAPLVVAAGDTRVIVVGTRFSVDYGDGTGGVDVRVTEGVVKVERAQKEVKVAAGQAWTSKQGTVVALADLPESESDDVATETPGVEPATGGSGDAKIEIDTNAPDVLKDRQSSVPDAKIPTTGLPTEVRKRPTKPEEEVRRQPAVGAGSGSSATMDVRKLVLKQPMLGAIDLGKLPKDAVIDLKYQAATSKGEQAAMLLYSVAVLQATKLGRTEDALRTLDQYMRRFEGVEYTTPHNAARWLRVRILCTRGAIDDACRQAAFSYMHQAPNSPARAIAEQLTLTPR